MKVTMLSTLAAALVGGVLTFGAATVRADADDEKPKNLKVLKDPGKSLGKGMKELSKGLGVKCEACHVKGKFDSDDVAAKLEARKFLAATVGEADKEKRAAALKALLPSLKLDKAADEAKVWAGVDMWKKQ